MSKAHNPGVGSITCSRRDAPGSSPRGNWESTKDPQSQPGRKPANRCSSAEAKAAQNKPEKGWRKGRCAVGK